MIEALWVLDELLSEIIDVILLYNDFSIILATLSFLIRKWSFSDRLIKHGILIGFGGALFLDVVLVDLILKLHTVNYPQSINIGSGMIGVILVVLGVYGWRTSV